MNPVEREPQKVPEVNPVADREPQRVQSVESELPSVASESPSVKRPMLPPTVSVTVSAPKLIGVGHNYGRTGWV